jgi:O-acetyl-ADP-ribose deacetylase (regulator of RNase III)
VASLEVLETDVTRLEVDAIANAARRVEAFERSLSAN